MYRQKEKLWYLSHSHPISSLRPKLCLKYSDFVFRTLFGWLRPQEGLIWKNDLHGLSSSRRNDRFWYKNRSNPSSYAKIRAIGMHLCQEAKNGAPHQTSCLMGSANNSLYCVSDLTLKMISDEKLSNTNCLRLVESVDFHIKIVSIRALMQKLELSEDSPVRRRNMARPIRRPSDTCLMGSATAQRFWATVSALKMASNWKVFNIKVVRLIGTVKIAFGLIFIQGRLLPQKGPARYSQKSCQGETLPGEKLAGRERFGPQDGFRLKSIQHQSCSSRRNG